MRTLVIKWQRLVNKEKTCPRCEGTEKEIDRAYKKLSKAFSNLGITISLEKVEMSTEEFKANPLNSNQILINNKSIEEWLNAKAGKSKCCDICGDEECRTIEFSGVNYEVVSETLIIKACLLAAAEMITQKTKLFNVPRGTLKSF